MMLLALLTKAVVAICVVYVPLAAVVESGTPVNVGDANGAYVDDAVEIVKNVASA